MAYDAELADRLREVLAGVPGVAEKRMFGGLAFLVQGRLAVAASGHGGLMLRVDPAAAATLLADPRVRPQEMRGTELSGWLHVETGAAGDDELTNWVATAVAYARTLPAPARKPLQA